MGLLMRNPVPESGWWYVEALSHGLQRGLGDCMKVDRNDRV